MGIRTIMFRGKHPNGEWVEGYYCGKVNKTFFSPAEDSAQIIDKDLFWHEVIPETVGQYTGLTDKNGKKIFEGDIVEGADFTVEDGGYGVVSFDEGAFEVNGNNICGTFHENYWGKEFEVIGNIHDNPELFGG